jgi:hypothetical protein
MMGSLVPFLHVPPVMSSAVVSAGTTHAHFLLFYWCCICTFATSSITNVLPPPLLQLKEAVGWVQYFYEEQLHRMECLSQEPVLFEDVLCQMHDMIQPEVEGQFTLRDLKNNRQLSGTLFNILFNLNKFIAFETRDPFLVRQVSFGLILRSSRASVWSFTSLVCRACFWNVDVPAFKRLDRLYLLLHRSCALMG